MKVTKVTKVEIDGKEVEIKKCPCCGGEAELKSSIEEESCGHGDTCLAVISYIKCPTCGLQTPILEFEEYMMGYPGAERKLEELVKISLETWNRRTL